MNVLDNIKKSNTQRGYKPDLLSYINVLKSQLASAETIDVKNFDNGTYFLQCNDLKEAYDYCFNFLTNAPAKCTQYNEFLIYYPKYSDFKNEIETSNSAINNAIEVLGNITANIKEIINIGGLIEKDKIKVTQDDRGLFDFSLASQGLFRPIEFYSHEFYNYLKNTETTDPFVFFNNPIGIIPDKKVNKIGNKYIFSFTGIEFECERRQKGATKVFETFESECFLNETENKIITTYSLADPKKVFNGKGKIKLKYSSTNKKCYLVYDEKNASARYVDFYVPANYVNDNNSYCIMSLFSQILASAILENYGIQTRISIIRCGFTNYGSTYDKMSINAAVPIKNYNETIQESYIKVFNVAANGSLLSTLFAGLKNKIEYENNVSKSCRGGFNKIQYRNYAYMVSLLERYKNFLIKNPKLNYTKTISDNFMAVNNLERNIEYSKYEFEFSELFLDENIQLILFKLYLNIDSIAIELNDMSEFVEQIKQRLSENEYLQTAFKINITDSSDFNYILFEYVKLIIRLKYVPIDGKSASYGDTPQQRIELNDKFDKKLLEAQQIIYGKN
tara:strand:- start:1202 stop:2887 length:1686 start_codon:yes stop_codon:yes gene_type:complete